MFKKFETNTVLTPTYNWNTLSIVLSNECRPGCMV